MVDKDGFPTLLGFIVITVVVLGIIFGGLAAFDNFTCQRYGRVTHQEVSWRAPNACYVHTPRGWFTYEQIRAVAP